MLQHHYSRASTARATKMVYLTYISNDDDDDYSSASSNLVQLFWPRRHFQKHRYNMHDERTYARTMQNRNIIIIIIHHHSASIIFIMVALGANVVPIKKGRPYHCTPRPCVCNICIENHEQLAVMEPPFFTSRNGTCMFGSGTN
jgi:hypothetical protein